MSDRKTIRRQGKGEASAVPDLQQAEAVAEVPPPQKVEAPPQAPRDPVDLGELEDLANMDASDFAALMSGGFGGIKLEEGQSVSGPVQRVTKNHIFVDVGARAEASLDRDEAHANVQVGDVVEAFIKSIDDGSVQLTTRLSGRAASAMLESAHASGVPVEGRIEGANKGGFDVRIGTARTFCPISHIDRMRVEEPELYLGRTFMFQVIEVGDKVVVSRRKLLEAEAEKNEAAFWGKVQEGDSFDGIVTSVMQYGVFVSIDGIDGLVPKRELGWGDVDPATFAPGQPMKVEVIGLDPLKKKLTLSKADKGSSPWSRTGEDFVIGGVYTGTVQNAQEYGVFVRLAPGLEGLLHKSAMPRRHARPQEGDEIQVRIDDIDHQRKRMSLAHPDTTAKESDEYERVEVPAPTGSLGTFADLLQGVSLKK